MMNLQQNSVRGAVTAAVSALGAMKRCVGMCVEIGTMCVHAPVLCGRDRFTPGQPAEVQNKLFTDKHQRVPLLLRIKLSFCCMHSRNRCSRKVWEVRKKKRDAKNQGRSMS